MCAVSTKSIAFFYNTMCSSLLEYNLFEPVRCDVSNGTVGLLGGCTEGSDSAQCDSSKRPRALVTQAVVDSSQNMLQTQGIQDLL